MSISIAKLLRKHVGSSQITKNVEEMIYPSFTICPYRDDELSSAGNVSAVEKDLSYPLASQLLLRFEHSYQHGNRF